MKRFSSLVIRSKEQYLVDTFKRSFDQLMLSRQPQATFHFDHNDEFPTFKPYKLIGENNLFHPKSNYFHLVSHFKQELEYVDFVNISLHLKNSSFDSNREILYRTKHLFSQIPILKYEFKIRKIYCEELLMA